MNLLDPVKTRLRDVTKIVKEKQRLWEIRLWDNFKSCFFSFHIFDELTFFSFLLVLGNQIQDLDHQEKFIITSQIKEI